MEGDDILFIVDKMYYVGAPGNVPIKNYNNMIMPAPDNPLKPSIDHTVPTGIFRNCHIYDILASTNSGFGARAMQNLKWVSGL